MNITTTSVTSHSLRRVLIVHGFAAAPDAHWFPWLRDALDTAGVDATVVTLPSPDAPKAAAWQAAVGEAIGVPDAGTWIVAHSLGGITVLRALAALTDPWQLGGLVLVSGFTGALKSLPVLDEYLSTDVDVERIANYIRVRAVVRLGRGCLRADGSIQRACTAAECRTAHTARRRPLPHRRRSERPPSRAGSAAAVERRLVQAWIVEQQTRKNVPLRFPKPYIAATHCHGMRAWRFRTVQGP